MSVQRSSGKEDGQGVRTGAEIITTLRQKVHRMTMLRNSIISQCVTFRKSVVKVFVMEKVMSDKKMDRTVLLSGTDNALYIYLFFYFSIIHYKV